MNVYGKMRNIWPQWTNSLPSPQNTNVGFTQILSHIQHAHTHTGDHLLGLQAWTSMGSTEWVGTWLWSRNSATKPTMVSRCSFFSAGFLCFHLLLLLCRGAAGPGGWTVGGDPRHHRSAEAFPPRASGAAVSLQQLWQVHGCHTWVGRVLLIVCRSSEGRLGGSSEGRLGGRLRVAWGGRLRVTWGVVWGSLDVSPSCDWLTKQHQKPCCGVDGPCLREAKGSAELSLNNLTSVFLQNYQITSWGCPTWGTWSARCRCPTTTQWSCSLDTSAGEHRPPHRSSSQLKLSGREHTHTHTNTHC